MIHERIAGMEKSRNPLPPRILILLDRLSNVQFSSLTRKQLKDHVEELKLALIDEFIKLTPGPERPQPRSANSPPVDVSNRSCNPERISSKPSHTDVSKDGKKPHAKNENTKSSNEISTKSLKSSSSAKPSYADLLKMAEIGRTEALHNRANNHESAANPSDQYRSNGSQGHSKSSYTSSRHRNLSPARSRINEEPRRDGKHNVNPYALNNRNAAKANSCKSADHSGGNQQKRIETTSSNPLERRPVGFRPDEKLKDSRNDNKNQLSKRREPKKSKKDEEEEIIARKRQKIKEENERVRIRNEVLAGKRSATELKNVVKQVSHGNTFLSCRPASLPNSSSRRHDSSFDRPLVGRSDPRRSVSGTEFLDDYDEEDDDDSFINDDEDREVDNETPDVSKAIRDIFGYDKRKYVGMDEDIEEASYSQILKEEARSQRIGRQEDLADIREEMRQKKLKKERLKQLNSKR